MGLVNLIVNEGRALRLVIGNNDLGIAFDLGQIMEAGLASPPLFATLDAVDDATGIVREGQPPGACGYGAGAVIVVGKFGPVDILPDVFRHNKGGRVTLGDHHFVMEARGRGVEGDRDR